MGSDWIIGALAFLTIGGAAALSVFHFGVHLKDPENLEAAKRVAADRESAATLVSSEGVAGRSLRQRLDEAPKLNDRLGTRQTGSLSIWDALFETKWSVLRSTLKGQFPQECPADVRYELVEPSGGVTIRGYASRRSTFVDTCGGPAMSLRVMP